MKLTKQIKPRKITNQIKIVSKPKKSIKLDIGKYICK